MIKLRTIAGLALAALTAAAALASVPAAAHHTGPESCSNSGVEMGIWTKSDRARLGLTTREQMADVRVNTPPATDCKENWHSSWWRRNSTNYDVMEPVTAAGDVNEQREFVKSWNYSVKGQTEYINTRWTGRLLPPTMESVNLYVVSSGGVRVWLDGNLVIDEWHLVASPTTYSYATPVLSPNMEHPVVVEHFHKTGHQRLELQWKTSTMTGPLLAPSIDLNGESTQHSAIHATNATGGECTETVAYRISGGEMWIWGYDCIGSFNADPDPEIVQFDGEINHEPIYQPQWITLYQGWNGPGTSTWGHWYFRWDTNKWYYFGNTGPRPSDLYGLTESSGYNVGSPRSALFDNYKENNQFVDFSNCPEFDNDPHQGFDRYYWNYGARFITASDAEDPC